MMALISKKNSDKFKKGLQDSGFFWTASVVLDRIGLPVFRFWPERKIASAILASQVTSILRAWGMSEEHILISEKHIIYSDLHGIDSHGCSMLRHYFRQLSAGSVTMTPDITIVSETETSALIDGGGGLGHVPADFAMKLAIKKCQNTGVGVVSVRNSGHFGAAGAYAAMAAQADLIGLAATDVLQPAMVPTHGLEAVLGTNPIAFSAPAEKNNPFLLDMATTIVPVGKLSMAWRKGRLIPKSWALDDRGKSIRNPRKAIAQRRLNPLENTSVMGGHKGYGLAAMVEILSSRLSGDSRENTGVGHFFLALDPGQFCETAAFKHNVDVMMDNLRSSKSDSSGNPVQVAGDPEYEAADERQRDGIPLTRCVIEDIRAVCNASEIPFLLDNRK